MIAAKRRSQMRLTFSQAQQDDFLRHGDYKAARDWRELGKLTFLVRRETMIREIRGVTSVLSVELRGQSVGKAYLR